MKNKAVKLSHYLEALARSIADAKPYYMDSAAKLHGHGSAVNEFPPKPGIYLILRRVNLPGTDYTMRCVNTQTPLVMYVGKTTSRRSVKRRLADHFGGNKPNYQGSQFRKFLFQICQDHDVVKRILWSKDTLIASIEIEEGDEVIDYVENLAIQVFQPRFNIKDR
jgi:hypothetical protein